MTISTISCDLSQYLRRNERIVQIFRIWICCLESYPNEIILEENVIIRSISNKTESYLHSKGYISPHHGTGKFILFSILRYPEKYLRLAFNSLFTPRRNEYRHAIVTIEPDTRPPNRQPYVRHPIVAHKTIDRAAIYEHTGAA